MISIIIPVYNAEKTLKRCLDSIKAQTYTDFECLLIDDGSKDSSLSICESYADGDDRFKVFHKENGGASSARNVGLDNASGEYICFCDADDYVTPNWLALFAKHIDKAGIVVSSYRMIFADHEDERIYLYDITQIPLLWMVLELNGDGGFLWNKCYHADVIKGKHIRFNPKYKLYEDDEFVSHYLSYICNSGVCVSKEATYNYYVPLDFEAKYASVETFDCSIDIYNHTKEFVSMDGFCHPIYTSLYRKLFDGLKYYYYHHKYEEAYEKLRFLHGLIPEDDTIALTRMTRFYIRHHLKLSHFFFKLLAKNHKL